MKRTIIYFVALATITSCTGESINTPTPKPGYKTIELKAAIEQTVSRTTLIDKDKKTKGINWEVGDQILVIDNYGKYGTLHTETAGPDEVFIGDVPQDFDQIEYAFYPASAFDPTSLNASDHTITLTLKKELTRINDIDSNPSYAIVNGEPSANFDNICGILDIPIAAKQSAYPIEVNVEANAVNINISGNFLFDYTNRTLTACGGNSREKKISMADKGKWGQISDKTNHFYFIVPPVTFDGGITVTAKIQINFYSFYTLDCEFHTENNIYVKRSQINPMRELLVVNDLDNTGEVRLIPD